MVKSHLSIGYPLDIWRSSGPAPGAPKSSRGFGQRLGPRLSEKALATSATNTQLISGARVIRTRNGAEQRMTLGHFLVWLVCVCSAWVDVIVLMFKDIELYMA